MLSCTATVLLLRMLATLVGSSAISSLLNCWWRCLAQQTFHQLPVVIYRFSPLVEQADVDPEDVPGHTGECDWLLHKQLMLLLSCSRVAGGSTTADDLLHCVLHVQVVLQQVPHLQAGQGAEPREGAGRLEPVMIINYSKFNFFTLT